MVNLIFNLMVVLCVMYLFSSGREYMKHAAKESFRPFWLDIVLMSWFACYSFYLLFYPDQCAIRYQLYNAPIVVHLAQLCIHAFKFNKKNGN